MPQFAVVTFGCQMNQHDSERMTEVLLAAGYRSAPAPEAADVIVLNTCSVREKAEQKLRSEVGRLAMLKRVRPSLVIAVAGCVAQQEGERLLRSMPHVDVVVGPDRLAELPDLLSQIEHGAPPVVRTTFDVDAQQFLAAKPREGAVAPSAFVTIMKGCNERCSFCIVPTTRGPERYRASSEIVEEIRTLVAAGVREVTLLGQTVNSYRDPRGALPKAPGAGEGIARWGRRAHTPEDETEFPALLREIAERVPRLSRLRYTSPHPRHLTPALARAHADLPVLAKHVHMPLQSGSDRVLKRMIRRYTAAEYVERIDLLRESAPGVTLSTDVIVGFPGETREDFAATVELVDRIGFVGLFGFKYSPRPFTPALQLEDDVPEAEKSARLTELFAVSDVHRRRHLGSLVGSTERVLIEGANKQGYTGRTERNEIVHVASRDDPTGEIVEVVITEAFKNSLSARLTDPKRAADLKPREPRPERRALPMI